MSRVPNVDQAERLRALARSQNETRSEWRIDPIRAVAATRFPLDQAEKLRAIARKRSRSGFFASLSARWSLANRLHTALKEWAGGGRRPPVRITGT